MRGFQSSKEQSELEELLLKNDVKLSDILKEEVSIGKLSSTSTDGIKLSGYLFKHPNLVKEMLDYMMMVPNSETTTKEQYDEHKKFAFNSAEIIKADLKGLADCFFDDFVPEQQKVKEQGEFILQECGQESDASFVQIPTKDFQEFKLDEQEIVLLIGKTGRETPFLAREDKVLEQTHIAVSNLARLNMGLENGDKITLRKVNDPPILREIHIQPILQYSEPMPAINLIAAQINRYFYHETNQNRPARKGDIFRHNQKEYKIVNCQTTEWGLAESSRTKIIITQKSKSRKGSGIESPAQLPLDSEPNAKFYKIGIDGYQIGRDQLNNDNISRNHAQIRYFASEKKFKLKDNGSMTGTFIKLQKPLILKTDQILGIGHNDFRVTVIGPVQIPTGGQQYTLNLKIIYGLNVDLGLQQLFSLEFLTEEKTVHCIGKKQDNESSSNLVLEHDKLLSNSHARFYLSEPAGVLCLEDSGSTNGTWLRLSEGKKESDFVDIEEGTVFRLGLDAQFVVHQENVEKHNIKEPEQEPMVENSQKKEQTRKLSDDFDVIIQEKDVLSDDELFKDCISDSQLENDNKQLQIKKEIEKSLKEVEDHLEQFKKQSKTKEDRELELLQQLTQTARAPDNSSTSQEFEKKMQAQFTKTEPSAHIPQIHHYQLMHHLLKFLETEPNIKPMYDTRAAYFCKVLNLLLEQRPNEPNKLIMSQLVRHIQSTSIKEFCNKLITTPYDIQVSHFGGHLIDERMFLVNAIFERLRESEDMFELENISQFCQELIRPNQNQLVLPPSQFQFGFSFLNAGDSSQNNQKVEQTNKIRATIFTLIQSRHNIDILFSKTNPEQKQKENKSRDIFGVRCAFEVILAILDQEKLDLETNSEVAFVNETFLCMFNHILEALPAYFRELNRNAPEDQKITLQYRASISPFGEVKLLILKLIRKLISIELKPELMVRLGRSLEFNDFFSIAKHLIIKYQWNNFMHYELFHILFAILNLKEECNFLIQDMLKVERGNFFTFIMDNVTQENYKIESTLQSRIRRGNHIWLIELANMIVGKQNTGDDNTRMLFQVTDEVEKERWMNFIFNTLSALNTTNLIDLGDVNPRQTDKSHAPSDKDEANSDEELYEQELKDLRADYRKEDYSQLADILSSHGFHRNANIEEASGNENANQESPPQNRNSSGKKKPQKSPPDRYLSLNDMEEEDLSDEYETLTWQDQLEYKRRVLEEEHQKQKDEAKRVYQCQKMKLLKEENRLLKQELESNQEYEHRIQESINNNAKYEHQLLQQKHKNYKFALLLQTKIAFNLEMDFQTCLASLFPNSHHFTPSCSEFFIKSEELFIDKVQVLREDETEDTNQTSQLYDGWLHKEKVMINQMTFQQNDVLHAVELYQKLAKIKGSKEIVRIHGVNLQKKKNDEDVVLLNVVSDVFPLERLENELMLLETLQQKIRVLIDMLRGLQQFQHDNNTAESFSPLQYASFSLEPKLEKLCQLVLCQIPLPHKYKSEDPAYYRLKPINFAHVAPEMFSKGKKSANSDIWQFGCLMYEILTGKKMWARLDAMQIQKRINTDESVLDYNRVDADQECGEQIKDTLEKCFRYLDDERPTVKELIDDLHKILETSTAAAQQTQYMQMHNYKF